jgi:hypothetical protein
MLFSSNFNHNVPVHEYMVIHQNLHFSFGAQNRDSVTQTQNLYLTEHNDKFLIMSDVQFIFKLSQLLPEFLQ